MSEIVRHALREARVAAGMSIAGLAERTLISESHLYNVLATRPRRPLTYEVVRACDDALYAGGLLVDLYAAEVGGDDVRRRAVVGALSTVGTLALGEPRLLVARMLRADLAATVGAGDWHETAVEYGQRFMTDPPADFASSLTADLLALHRQIRAGEDSTAVQLAAPRLMTLHGMALGNTGHLVDAARWYRAARHAADRTDDGQLQQWVRGREAFRRGYEGAPAPEVLAIAAGVDDVEGQLATAQAYARLAEPRRAYAAIDAARRCHDAGDQSETTIYAMPPWRMGLSTGYVYALLGDERRAAAELDIVAPPPHVQRWEAQHQMEYAVAHARAGDTRMALDLARETMHGLPDEQRSVVLDGMAREVRCATRS